MAAVSLTLGETVAWCQLFVTHNFENSFWKDTNACFMNEKSEYFLHFGYMPELIVHKLTSIFIRYQSEKSLVTRCDFLNRRILLILVLLGCYD